MKQWRRTLPAEPGWYWMQLDREPEIVKVFKYQVEPGSPVDLEVAHAGRPHTAPIFDKRFMRARWLGPIAVPDAVEIPE